MGFLPFKTLNALIISLFPIPLLCISGGISACMDSTEGPMRCPPMYDNRAVTNVTTLTVVPVEPTPPRPKSHLKELSRPLIHARSLNESTPWHIHNLLVYIDTPCATANQNISFDICDTNAGLEFDTTCMRSLPPGSTGTLADPTDWFMCEDTDVEFQYQGGVIGIQRVYNDTS